MYYDGMTPRHLRFSAAIFATFLLSSTPASAALNDGIADAVRAAFPDDPVMHAVAKCESGYRQFNVDGSVLRGGAGKGYVGVFQIGESLHAAYAASLGYDIMTVEGNIAYAKHLYGQRGSAPWKECVPQGAAPQPAAAADAALTANLGLGMTHSQVLLLQRYLNARGFTVAAEGPGSPGNETTTFGMRTRDALRRFQCSRKIACEGDERTTGYGRLGPKTRAAFASPF